MAGIDIIIPSERVKEGIDLCLRQASTLIESAKILYDNKQYATSLALSILGTEELAKVRSLLNHRDAQDGVTRKEWRGLTGLGGDSHKIKLTYEYLNAKERIIAEISKERYMSTIAPLIGAVSGEQTLPAYEELIKEDPEALDHLEALDRMKQDCLYVNWNGAEWKCFINRLSKHRQKAMALVELSRATGTFWLMARWAVFPYIYRPGTPEFEEFKNHSTNINLNEARSRLKSKGYKKKAEIYKTTILQYVRSPDKTKA